MRARIVTMRAARRGSRLHACGIVVAAVVGAAAAAIGTDPAVPAAARRAAAAGAPPPSPRMAAAVRADSAGSALSADSVGAQDPGAAQRLIDAAVRAALPLAVHDPEAAAARLAHAGPQADTICTRLVETLLADLPEPALRLARAHARRRPETALALFALVAQRLAQRREYAAALALAESFPLAPAQRERERQALLDAMTATDPAGAARWAVARLDSAPALLGAVHDRWLQHDPRSALAFATQLAPGRVRDDLLAEAMSRWLAQDEPSAHEWLRQYPPTPALDAALARHAGGDELVRRDAAAALAVAARIADAGLRSRTQQEIVTMLAGIDAAAVLPLLQASPALTAAERDQLVGLQPIATAPP